jgi:hypothetical protein
MVPDLATKNRLLTLLAEDRFLQINVRGGEETDELVINKAWRIGAVRLDIVIIEIEDEPASLIT